MVAEAQALVRQFLGTLSDRDQQFARLRFIDGLSQDEAGKQSGYSRQEARTREDKLKGQCVKFLSQKGWPHPALALAVLALVMRG